MTKPIRQSTRTMGSALPGFQHIQRIQRPADELPWAKVLPGEFYVSRLNEEIVTVLGSCISVCMWDRDAGIGGMNHFLLPEPPEQQTVSTRYGIWAMEYLMDSMVAWGARREHMEVKVTGGGNIGIEGCKVAGNNIAFMDHYLEGLGLRPVVRDVGGPQARKVRFHPLTGRLLVFKLPVITSDLNAELENPAWPNTGVPVERRREK